MALNFDTRRAPTGPELDQLLQAVIDSGPGDETIWLECKSQLDLTHAAGQAPLAKAICGMANRLPHVAASHCGGRGYIVVGADSGALIGISPIDPAKLADGLERYLGQGHQGPSWHPHTLNREGKSVLIIEVDPPRQGDPIYPIRKTLNEIQNGAVFVRRPGKTERATGTEIDGLQARASNSTLRDVCITVAKGQIHKADLSSEPRERWLDQLRLDCLQSLEPKQPPGLAADMTVAKAMRIMSQLDRVQEKRTPAEYTQEVDKYISSCREVFDGVLEDAGREQLSPLLLMLHNNPDDNLRQVEVEVHIPGDVFAFEPAGRHAINDSVARLPRPPRAYGPYTRNLAGFGPDHRFLVSASTFPNPQNLAPKIQIDYTGSVTLTLPALDLRPQSSSQLREVIVMARLPITSDQIIATWKATATNMSGVVRGDVPLFLTNETWTVKDALTPNPNN